MKIIISVNVTDDYADDTRQLLRQKTTPTSTDRAVRDRVDVSRHCDRVVNNCARRRSRKARTARCRRMGEKLHVVMCMTDTLFRCLPGAEIDESGAQNTCIRSQAIRPLNTQVVVATWPANDRLQHRMAGE